MPPSSALSLPVSAAPARQLSRANRPRKRKSSAEQLLFAAVVFFANMLHKTDGSYGNRPFLCSKQDVRESAFSPKDPSPPQCLLFLFFKKRKRSPLEEKKTSSCGPKTKPPPSVRRGQRRGTSSVQKRRFHPCAARLGPYRTCRHIRIMCPAAKREFYSTGKRVNIHSDRGTDHSRRYGKVQENQGHG